MVFALACGVLIGLLAGYGWGRAIGEERARQAFAGHPRRKP
jgi:hypothetical protein